MTDSLAGRGLDLPAIQKRLDGITPPPWEIETTSEQLYVGPQTGTSHPYDGGLPMVGRPVAELYPRKGRGSLADAEFIAHAPSDVAGLLAACRALREALQEAVDATTKGPVKWLVPIAHDTSFHAWLDRAVGVLAQTQGDKT